MEINNISEIQSVSFEIEDFLNFEEILLRAIEQLNFENNTFNSKKTSIKSIEITESNKDQIALNVLQNKKIILKLKPELYKIRIGKKKTGLPNFDYPPIISKNIYKNSNFTIFSIEYEETHLDDPEIIKKNLEKNIFSKNDDIIISNKSNNLKENLIHNSVNNSKDINYISTNNLSNDMKFAKSKKCCDKCVIF